MLRLDEDARRLPRLLWCMPVAVLSVSESQPLSKLSSSVCIVWVRLCKRVNVY